MKPLNVFNVSLILLHGLQLAAQVLAPTMATGPSRVFILPFGDTAAALPQDARELSEFAPSMLQWRLRSERQISASRVSSLACGHLPVKQEIQAQCSFDEVCYSVRGSIAPRVSDKPSNTTSGSAPLEMVLSYELDKVSGCAPEVLLRRSVPMTAATSLSVTSVMADLITLKLEEVLEPARTSATKTVEAAGTDADLNTQLTALCQGANHACMRNAEAALPLLLELVKRHPKNASERDWLGRTQADAGHFLDASRSFDAELKLLVNAPAKQQWPVLERSADMEYHLDYYSLAAQRYRAALDALARLGTVDSRASGPQIRLKLARSLRFNGDRKGAFDALLKGPQVGNEARSYIAELRDLVASLQPDELTWADKRLTSADVADTDANVKAQVYNREAEVDLDSVSLMPTDKPQLAKVDAELKKADALADVVEISVRVATLWWRTQWYVAQEQWELARSSLDESVRLNKENDSLVQYRAAVFYYTWASLPTDGDQQKPKLWERAAAMAQPLLERSRSTTPPELLQFAESIYRNANHNVHQDKITQDEYEKIVKLYPTDFVIRRGLMGLYTDFMPKPKLALEAANAAYSLPETKRDTGTLLDIAEVYVINAQYGDAENVFQSLQSTLAGASSTRDLGYGAVSDFYQTWVALATQDSVQATQAISAWRVTMGRFRNAQTGSFPWIFAGATDALKRLPTLQKKGTLLQMIDAMMDSTVPLPHDS